MSVDKLERVLLRLRRRNPDARVVSNDELNRCVMLEIGTDQRTLWANRKALLKLGWIKPEGRKKIKLTDDDLGGDY